jgi:hypothetical protein
MSKLRQIWVGVCAIACLATAMPGQLRAQQDRGREPWDQGRQSDQSDQQRDRQSDDQYRDSDRQQRQQRDRDQQRWQREERSSRTTWGGQSSEQAGLGVALDRSDNQEGALVERVFRNSPAEEMGLREGDRILSINDEDVESNRDLMDQIQKLNPGDKVTLEIERDGNEQELSGRLESRQQALISRSERDQQRGMSTRQSWSDRGRSDQYRERDQFGGRQQQGGQYSRFEDSRGSHGLRSQIDSLERQVQQIQRQLDDLRVAVDGRGQRSQWQDRSRDQSSWRDYGRESTAGYDEYGPDQRTGQRTSYDRWSDGYQRGQSQRPEDRPSPGGQVGESRQRPGSGFDD